MPRGSDSHAKSKPRDNGIRRKLKALRKALLPMGNIVHIHDPGLSFTNAAVDAVECTDPCEWEMLGFDQEPLKIDVVPLILVGWNFGEDIAGVRMDCGTTTHLDALESVVERTAPSLGLRYDRASHRIYSISKGS